jgi:V8-like Glu-specific endopeptidase
MDESFAGRLEITGTRARAFFGTGPGNTEATESTEAGGGPPSAKDAAKLAKRIERGAAFDTATARVMADEIVAQAHSAMEKLAEAANDSALSERDALALESVIHVRARPALRVRQNALESLANYPGSEIWQDFITDYEEKIMSTANVTGAVIVSVFGTGNPPWVQGSAWLIAENRVVTNRHVVFSERLKLAEPDSADAMKLAKNVTIYIDFAYDDRNPAASVRRKVTGVRYVASFADPVDIAVLDIEGMSGVTPLKFQDDGVAAPRNLFVVGHPAPMVQTPPAVQAVFGNPDGRKRVSFGKILDGPAEGDLLHDASTVGGYSGAPVVGISSGMVAALHYYGQPSRANLAVKAEAILAHSVQRHLQP